MTRRSKKSNKPCLSDNRLKFRILFREREGRQLRSETLWGSWLDRRERLILVRNNAYEVPLVVNDVIRVARVRGEWRMVETVRLTESIVTWTSFEPPVTVTEAKSIYDGLVADGHAVYTEGDGEMMTTAWVEFLPFDRVLHALGPICIRPGWKLWALFTPEQRRAEIDHHVDFEAGGLPATG